MEKTVADGGNFDARSCRHGRHSANAACKALSDLGDGGTPSLCRDRGNRKERDRHDAIHTGLQQQIKEYDDLRRSPFPLSLRFANGVEVESLVVTLPDAN